MTLLNARGLGSSFLFLKPFDLGIMRMLLIYQGGDPTLRGIVRKYDLPTIPWFEPISHKLTVAVSSLPNRFPLGVVFKQSSRITIFGYLGVLLGYVNLTILYPRILTIEQYGLVTTILAIVTIFTRFTLLGFPQIIIRFFPFFRTKDSNYHQGFLFISLFYPLLAFLILSGIFYLLREWVIQQYNSALLEEYYLLIIPISFLVMLFTLLQAFSRTVYRAVIPVIFNEVLLRILVALLLASYFLFSFAFGLFMGAYIFIYSIPVVLLALYLLYHREFNLKPPPRIFDFKRLGEILEFGTFSFLTGANNMLVNKLDIIMLGMLTNIGNAAIYYVAFSIATVVSIPTRAILQIAPTLVANAMKENDLPLVQKLYKKTSLNQLLVGSFVFLLIWFNLDSLVAFLPASFRQLEGVVLFISLAKLFDIATGINGQIIVNSKYYRFNFYVTLILIGLTVLSNYLLIPLYDMVGAAMATALVIFVFNSTKMIYVYYRFRMQPFDLDTVKALLVIGAVTLTGYFLPSLENLYLSILYKSVIITVVFGFLTLWFRVSEDINQYGLQIFKKIKDRF